MSKSVDPDDLIHFKSFHLNPCQNRFLSPVALKEVSNVYNEKVPFLRNRVMMFHI